MTLENYWNDLELESKFDEVKKFVLDSKTFILSAAIERQLDLLLQIVQALSQSSEIPNLAVFISELRELKLVQTKIYDHLSKYAKKADLSNNQRQWLEVNRTKLATFRAESKMTVSSALMMPRMKIEVAKEIL